MNDTIPNSRGLGNPNTIHTKTKKRKKKDIYSQRHIRFKQLAIKRKALVRHKTKINFIYN
jgi:hypothetical protein